MESQTGLLTPVERFYVRNHFPVPGEWSGLVVGGSVQKPFSLTLSDLMSFPPRSVTATLECAGNGRAFLNPPVAGTPWRLGAVGTAAWTGIPLKYVLERAGIADSAVEVLFEGADGGILQEVAQTIPFARSLPVNKALHEDTLLAYAMNEEPLTPAHGAPLRLIVPGWYGMASVKWLARISVLDVPFEGFYQKHEYVVERDGVVEPLREMAVRSIITSPRDHEEVAWAPQKIRGYCWSGYGSVGRVDVSDDQESSWRAAEIATHSQSSYAWHPWQLIWKPPSRGEFRLIARATDEVGNQQPVGQAWNVLGYANNGCQQINVRVE